MKRGALLTSRQLFWTAFLMIFPTILLFLPGDLLRLGGRYAWCAPLAAAALGLPAVWVAGRLGARYGSMADATLEGLGPVLGRAPLIAFGAGLAAYVLVMTREFAEVAAVTFVFQSVPVALLTCLGLVVAGLGAWLGITVIGRGAEIVGPVMVVVFLTLSPIALYFSHVVWALPLWPRNADFARLQPLGRTWGFLLEPVFLTLLLDHVDEEARRSAGRTFVAVVCTVAAITAGVLWVMVADFGPARGGELVLPFFNLAKEITLGAFIGHLEILLIPIILLGGAGKMAIFYWLWSRTAARVTGGGRGVWLLLGLAGLGVGSIAAFGSAVALDAALYGLLFGRALPVILGAVAVAYGAAALVPRGASS